MEPRPSWSARSLVTARQIIPFARIITFTISGVMSCAAQMRSPSFSRSSSSATTTKRPFRMSSMACSTVPNGMLLRAADGGDGGGTGRSVRRPSGDALQVRGNQPAHVLPDHVALQVHAVARSEETQRGVPEGELDE